MEGGCYAATLHASMLPTFLYLHAAAGSDGGGGSGGEGKGVHINLHAESWGRPGKVDEKALLGVLFRICYQALLDSTSQPQIRLVPLLTTHQLAPFPTTHTPFTTIRGMRQFTSTGTNGTPARR